MHMLLGLLVQSCMDKAVPGRALGGGPSLRTPSSRARLRERESAVTLVLLVNSASVEVKVKLVQCSSVQCGGKDPGCPAASRVLIQLPIDYYIVLGAFGSGTHGLASAKREGGNGPRGAFPSPSLSFSDRLCRFRRRRCQHLICGPEEQGRNNDRSLQPTAVVVHSG